MNFKLVFWYCFIVNFGVIILTKAQSSEPSGAIIDPDVLNSQIRDYFSKPYDRIHEAIEALLTIRKWHEDAKKEKLLEDRFKKIELGIGNLNMTMANLTLAFGNLTNKVDWAVGNLTNKVDWAVGNLTNKVDWAVGNLTNKVENLTMTVGNLTNKVDWAVGNLTLLKFRVGVLESSASSSSTESVEIVSHGIITSEPLNRHHEDFTFIRSHFITITSGAHEVKIYGHLKKSTRDICNTVCLPGNSPTRRKVESCCNKYGFPDGVCQEDLRCFMPMEADIRYLADCQKYCGRVPWFSANTVPSPSLDVQPCCYRHGFEFGWCNADNTAFCAYSVRTSPIVVGSCDPFCPPKPNEMNREIATCCKMNGHSDGYCRLLDGKAMCFPTLNNDEIQV